MILHLHEPVKRILAQCIIAELPDVDEARERLRIAVADGNFGEDEAAVIAALIDNLGVRDAA